METTLAGVLMLAATSAHHTLSGDAHATLLHLGQPTHANISLLTRLLVI